MLENELITLIGNVGFPIAITIYLLITRDKTIQGNTQALKDLKQLIERYYQKR